MSISKPAGRAAAYRRQCGRLLALLLLSIVVAACSDSPTAPEPVDQPGTITESVAPQVFVDSIPTGTVRYSDPNDAASLQVACDGTEVGAVEPDGRVLVMRFTGPLAVDEEGLPVTVECTATGTDELGNATERTFSVEVNANPDNPPSASLDGPTSAAQGEDVSFTYSVTDDNAVESITLDYGDGMTTSLTAAEGSTTYAYAAPGTYTLELTATDDAGQRSAPALHTIEVTAPPETYSIDASCVSFWDGAPEPCSVEFLNVDTGKSVTAESDEQGRVIVDGMDAGTIKYRVTSDYTITIAQLTRDHLPDKHFNVIDGVPRSVVTWAQANEVHDRSLQSILPYFELSSDIDQVNMSQPDWGDLVFRIVVDERPYTDNFTAQLAEFNRAPLILMNWSTQERRAERPVGIAAIEGVEGCEHNLREGLHCYSPDRPQFMRDEDLFSVVNEYYAALSSLMDELVVENMLPHRPFTFYKINGDARLTPEEALNHLEEDSSVYDQISDTPWNWQAVFPGEGKILVAATEAGGIAVNPAIKTSSDVRYLHGVGITIDPGITNALVSEDEYTGQVVSEGNTYFCTSYFIDDIPGPCRSAAYRDLQIIQNREIRAVSWSMIPVPGINPADFYIHLE